MSTIGTCRRVVSGLLFLGAALFGAATSGWADTQDVKLGILFSITGPFANISPPLLDAAKMAVDEVNNNGGLLNGRKLQTIIADTKGTTDGATAAATTLVKQDNVAAVIGATTSMTTLAAAHNVTIPNGVLMISPSATATVLTSLEDNDFVFRVAPSDADQGWVLAGLVHAKGFRRVAVTYVATAYGSGINDTFRNNFQNYKGTITAALPHEANKSSYANELAQLTKYDPEALVVIDFAHAGGITLVKDALANGHFKQLIGTNSLMDQDLITEIGADKLKGMFFTAPSIDGSRSAAQKFVQLYKAAFDNRTGHELFAAQAYDAVMLTALAIQKAGTTDRTKIRDALREICCSPGEVIEPGEWAKATAAIAAGKKINYEGASGNCDFDEYGNVRGVYRHYEIENGAFKEVELLKP
jgi:branched-chain amino acid transport system substrate-binding protein